MKSIRAYLAVTGLLFAFSASLAVAEAKKVYKLGVIAPLSGDLAFFGKAHLNSAKLLLEDVSEFGNLVEIIYEDSSYDTKKAVAAFKKLTSIDNVDVVFSFGGPMLSALAPLAESAQIPFFAPESEIRDVQGRKFTALFRNEAGEFGRALLEELRAQKKKNIGIVKNRNQFMQTIVTGITDNLVSGETATVVIDEDPGSTEFRTPLLKLKNKQFDMLGVFLLPGSHRAFLAQAKAAGIAGPFFGVEEFVVPEENAGFESYTEGTLVIAPYVPEEFRSRYIKAFGSDLGIEYGVEYYDFLSLLFQVLMEQGEHVGSGADLLTKMRFVGERTGVSGPYTVKTTSDKGVYYSFPIAVYKVQAGKLVVQRLIQRPR